MNRNNVYLVEAEAIIKNKTVHFHLSGEDFLDSIHDADATSGVVCAGILAATVKQVSSVTH